MPPGSQTLSRNQYAPSLMGPGRYAVAPAEANGGWAVFQGQLLRQSAIGQILTDTDPNGTKISVEGSQGDRANRDDSPTFGGATCPERGQETRSQTPRRVRRGFRREDPEQSSN